MKNLTLSAIVVFLSFQFSPTQLSAASTMTGVSVTEINAPAISKEDNLLLRLEELKATDRTGMSVAEKRQLRKETRSVKKELRQINGGVYLSVGAILIIVLLLILIL